MHFFELVKKIFTSQGTGELYMRVGKCSFLFTSIQYNSL